MALVAGVLPAGGSGAASAVTFDVAEDAAVTLNGVYGVVRPASGRAANPVAPASSLTVALVLSAATVWNDGPVSWEALQPSGASADDSIEVDLGGLRELVGFNA